MAQRLIFQSISQTIRQIPENHQIARFSTDKGNWQMDTDIQANPMLVAIVQFALMDYGHKCSTEKHTLCEDINNVLHFRPN